MTRKREMKDVWLTARELRTLRKGGHVYKHLGGQVFNIAVAPHEAKRDRQIRKLRAKLRALLKTQKTGGQTLREEPSDEKQCAMV
jgi:hypothetical protein